MISQFAMNEWISEGWAASRNDSDNDRALRSLRGSFLYWQVITKLKINRLATTYRGAPGFDFIPDSGKKFVLWAGYNQYRNRYYPNFSGEKANPYHLLIGLSVLAM
jgi:hypothetical protein